MTLFDNAIESIQIGVEDFNHNDERRLASAVRNIHAGIMLLCKEKLRQISPDDNILLYKQYVPKQTADNKVEIVPSGRNTVDAQQIKDRFRDFGIAFDWKPLDAINTIRNQIEHSHLEEPRDAARELLSRAHVVIANLLEDVLCHEPVGTLGKECWGALLENTAVFDKQLRICQDSLATIPWRTEAAVRALPEFVCPRCESVLVRRREFEDPSQIELFCAACGEDIEMQEVMAAALEIAFAADEYISKKDGGEPLIEECPDCGAETYVMEEGACAACDFKMPDDAECAVCSTSLSTQEYRDHNGLCSYHNYTAQKDD
jgi:hypothetical protein